MPLPALLTVPEHVVLGRARGSLQASVGHEVEVPLHGVADASLDHGPGEHVAGLVLVIPEASAGEKTGGGWGVGPIADGQIYRSFLQTGGTSRDERKICTSGTDCRVKMCRGQNVPCTTEKNQRTQRCRERFNVRGTRDTSN